MFVLLLQLLFVFNQSISHATDATHLTILFTNDLHSNFLPQGDAPHLGGYARLKTAIDRERRLNPNTLVIDAGDFSEGTMFYALGAGEESLRMLDRMGYDFTVIGNHDWFNGAAHFLDLVDKTKPRLKFLGANYNIRNFDQAERFKKVVIPYEIREINGVKVAFIGITTYEFFFDDFFTPVKPTNPLLAIRKLSNELKKKADVIIAVSHISLFISKMIVEFAPAIDGVIGAHDHAKLTKPWWVKPPLIRTNRKWMVETGDKGQYLGRLDLSLFNRKDAGREKKPRIHLDQYKLIQMDSSIPEDPEIARIVADDVNELKGIFGETFFDPLGFAITPIKMEGLDSVMGNLIADAYRERTGADIALEHNSVLSDGFRAGPVSLADCFNVLGIAFNPATKRSWNLMVMPIMGLSLERLLLTLFNTPLGRVLGGMSMSGIEMIYKPFIDTPSKPDYPQYDPGNGSDSDRNDRLFNFTLNKTEIRINGKPIDHLKTYRLAVGSGIIYGLRALNKHFVKILQFPLNHLEDTGVESWRVLADHIKTHTPLSGQSVGAGRIRSLRSDLRVSQDNVSVVPKTHSEQETEFLINVTVHNFGGRDSTPGRMIRLMTNKNGMDGTVDIQNIPIGEPQRLPMIPAGKSHDLAWTIVLPRSDSYFPLTIQTDLNKEELLRSNNETTVWILPN